MIEVVFGERDNSAVNNAIIHEKMYANQETCHFGNCVISLYGMLDIGDIQSSVTSQCREKMLQKIILLAFPNKGVSIAAKDWHKYVTHYDTLLARAEAGEHVRIWYHDAPCSRCGFLSTVHMIAHTNCNISAIAVPLGTDEDGSDVNTTWGDFSRSEIIKHLHLTQTLSPNEIKILSNKWVHLQQENAPIRIVLNGRLLSVPEEFYDQFILQNLAEQSLPVCKLLILMMQRKLHISEGMMIFRINKLLGYGVLEVVEQADSLHHCVVKRLK